jgi:hypothetical protein
LKDRIKVEMCDFFKWGREPKQWVNGYWAWGALYRPGYGIKAASVDRAYFWRSEDEDHSATEWDLAPLWLEHMKNTHTSLGRIVFRVELDLARFGVVE